MNEDRVKIIKEAFESTKNGLLLHYYFWEELKKHPETVIYIFKYIEEKIDKDKKNETLIELLMNVSTLDIFLKRLESGNAKTPYFINLLFDNIDLFMCVIAGKIKKIEPDKSAVNTASFILYSESIVYCFKEIEILREAFDYLKKSNSFFSFSINQKIYNLVRNINEFRHIQQTILTIPELKEEEKGHYIHLIYENSHVNRLFKLLSTMASKSLLTVENLDKLFSTDLNLLSIPSINLFRINTKYVVAAITPSTQELFDAFFESIAYHDKVNEIYNKAQTDKSLSTNDLLDILHIPRIAFLIFKCAEFSLYIEKILIFCNQNNLPIMEEQVNALIKNKHHLKHIEEALGLIKYNLLAPIKQKIFNEICNSPEEAKLIVYKNNLDTTTKQTFKNYFNCAQGFGGMWESIKNSEGKKIDPLPDDIKKKIVYESGEDEIDEMTHSAIIKKYFKN